MKVFLFFVFGFFSLTSFSQIGQTQTVYGQVQDAFTHNAIPGALVEVLRSAKPIKTTTDIDGYFTLDSVPLGRQSFQANSVGFNPQTKTNIIVSQGKQTQLLFELEEQIIGRKKNN